MAGYFSFRKVITTYFVRVRRIGVVATFCDRGNKLEEPGLELFVRFTG